MSLINLYFNDYRPIITDLKGLHLVGNGAIKIVAGNILYNLGFIFATHQEKGHSFLCEGYNNLFVGVKMCGPILIPITFFTVIHILCD